MTLKLDQLKTNNAQNWTQINWAKARLDLAGLQYEVLKAHRSGNVIELRNWILCSKNAKKEWWIRY
jgi:hypothetical protein